MDHSSINKQRLNFRVVFGTFLCRLPSLSNLFLLPVTKEEQEATPDRVPHPYRIDRPSGNAMRTTKQSACLQPSLASKNVRQRIECVRMLLSLRRGKREGPEDDDGWSLQGILLGKPTGQSPTGRVGIPKTDINLSVSNPTATGCVDS